MPIIKIVDVEGIVGGNTFSILAECRELAQREHCLVRIEMNGKKVTVSEHEPFWVTVKNFESK